MVEKQRLYEMVVLKFDDGVWLVRFPEGRPLDSGFAAS
jgi:hypothetical protein